MSTQQLLHIDELPAGPPAFSRELSRLARPVSFGADRAATMSDARTVSMVQTGAMDLFAVDLGEALHGEALLPRPGTPLTPEQPGASGRWTYLGRANAGSMIVGAPPDSRHSLLARPLPGTQLLRLPVSSVQRVTMAEAAAGGSDLCDEVVAAVERGLSALADGVRGPLAPRDFVAITAGVETTLPARAAARTVDTTGWIRALSGRLLPGGESVLHDAPAPRPQHDDGLMFVTGADWVVAEVESVVTTVTTESMIADGTLWAAMERQQARTLFAVDRLVLRRQERAEELLERRRERDERVVRQAIGALTGVVDGTTGFVPPSSSDPGMIAMRLVAERMGLTITAPTASNRVGRAVNSIEAIALASRLRIRQLHLLGTWWKDDFGPLVGFRKDDTPMALLPARGGYVVIDPETTTPRRVDAEVAKEMTAFATSLYRPAPDGVSTGRKLLRFGLVDCRRDVSALVFAGLVVALLGLLVPVITGRVLGDYVPSADRRLIYEGCLAVVASGFISGVFAAVQNLSVLRLEGRADNTIQAAVWDRLLSLPLRFFAQFPTGELSTTALAVNAVRETVSGVATATTLALFTGLMNLVLVFFYSVTLALLATGLVVVALVVCWIAGVRQVALQRQIFGLEKKLASRVFQLLTGLPKLRVAAAEDRAFAVWAGQFATSRRLTMRARRIQNNVTVFNAGFTLIGSLLIFWLVGSVLHLSTASFLSFFSAYTLLIAAVLQFTAVAITVLSVVPMVESLDPIMAASPEIRPEMSNPGELSGLIEFNHVNFGYAEDAPLVLDDVSVTIKPGEFVAVVGPTGCGKSTLVRLLLGFEQPTAGAVLFDGQDLSQLDVLAVRRQCGVVLQNGALLAGDIRTNIIGNSAYTIDDAWEAARMSGFDKDIESMPMKMFTVLSEGASTLSGGQRQRLMIARALVSRPRILIMDEATSALDNPSQEKVAESTRRMRTTRIVIAHRLSTIRHADRILVMDAGRVVQQGTFDQLVAEEGGLFATLARRQLA